MRLKGHKLESIERFGVQSGYCQARCSCGWKHEGYFSCTTLEDARRAYRRHLEAEKAKQEAA